MSETYNGWKNRETWVVPLHFDNTEYLYRATQDKINQYRDNPAKLRRYFPRFVRELLEGNSLFDEDFIDTETLYRADGSPRADFDIRYNARMRRAWARVNWDEIVKHVLED